MTELLIEYTVVHQEPVDGVDQDPYVEWRVYGPTGRFVDAFSTLERAAGFVEGVAWARRQVRDFAIELGILEVQR